MACYITRDGARALAAELNTLLTSERPRIVQEVAEAAAQGDRSENAEYIYGKKKLREIDRRVRFLTRRLDELVVVTENELPDDRDCVYFSARVTVEDEEGERREYQLVGPDESDPERGLLSYQAPLGRALMKRRAGDTVQFSRPRGEVELRIVRIRYVSEAP